MNERERQGDGFVSAPLAVLRRRRLVILAVAVLTSLAALAFSLAQEKRYSASASLLFRDPGFDAKLFDSTVFQPSNDPDREAETNLRLVSLDVVTRRTATRLAGRGLSAHDVSKEVTASPEGASNVVKVTATDPDRGLAALLADTFAREFIAFRQAADRAKVDGARRLVDRSIRSLSPSELDGARGRDLQHRAQQLDVLSALQTGNAELVQPAERPSSPSSPKTARSVVLAAILGLGLGLGLAFVVDALDRRLKDPQEISEIFDRPMLAGIPLSKAIRGSASALPPVEAESFRMLRANLMYFNVDHEIRSVAVTSASQGDGKSTVAWNLAVASAASGANVLLIEADLRHPVLAKRFEVSSPGLSRVLSGSHTPAEAAVPVPVSLLARSADNVPTLDLLLAGPPPPNPTELLSSQRMASVLSAAEETYDLVVLDTPPISIVSDAIPLLGLVSGVLVVSRLGVATRRGTTHLHRQLENLRAPVLGVVVNGLRRSEQAYYYGGAYGYDGAAGEEVAGSAPAGDIS